MKSGVVLFFLSVLPPLGAQETSPDQALRAAVLAGDTRAMKSAIKKGANVNQGMPLAEAASGYCLGPTEARDVKQCPEVVRVLVEAGADVNKSNPGGWNALMGAADEGYLEVVKYLVSKGAVVDAKTRQGRTALIRSAYHGQNEVISYLISKGADVNLADNGGVTALILAAQGGHDKTVRVLLKAGANKSARTADQNSALSLAETKLQTYAGDLKKTDKKDGLDKYYQERVANYQRTVALLKGADLKSAGPLIGRVFSADGKKLEITGESITKARKSARLVIKSSGGEINARVVETLHSKIKAVAEKGGAAKGDSVYLER